MNSADLKKARDITANLRRLRISPKKNSPIKSPLSLDQMMRDLGKPRIQVVKEPVYLGRPGRDGKDGQSIKGERGPTGPKPVAGIDFQVPKTPIKGIDYLTEEEKEEFIKQVLSRFASIDQKQDEKTAKEVVDEEFVKKIVKIMHSLPEKDRLDVQGIRNFQSFVFGGTKYKVEELMHGGGSGSGGATLETPSGLVNASNTTFTPTSEPQYVVADGITSFDGAGYTWVSPNIVMDVAPSQYIRDAI